MGGHAGSGQTIGRLLDHLRGISFVDLLNAQVSPNLQLSLNCVLWVDGHFPPARSDEFLQVYIYLTTLELNDEEDIYEWCLTDVPTTRYSTGDVYWKLKPEEEEVPWAKVVWIRGGIPKQSFLTWLFMLNRCPTRDRLLHWGIQTDSSCLLSNNAPESRDHILFQCAYAWDLLCQTLNRCRVTPLWSQNDSVAQMLNLTGDRT